ncbi:tRNAse Z TRZ4, mitochondrial-like [Papaver somniferum]|uniref:tRNAse Z TRZ4, mitochondrial-like n=1 Tax=Papaver somniferum TaxID=3469 RepID=UPI000E6FBEDE|nr:tRNAse Z TRZ4, mitochondrial-like [Papaver somniferum]
MEENYEPARCNKRRAEGRDRKGAPRLLERKVPKIDPLSTTCYVQILGTGLDTQDTSPSICLFFDKQRFIFNAGEGLQRFCSEHKIKLSKIGHIFVSRACSETTGGLAGLLLTLAGIGDKGMSVNICGPPGLKCLIDAISTFVPNNAVLHTHIIGSTSTSNGGAIFDSEILEEPTTSTSNGAPIFDSNRLFKEPIAIFADEVVKISALLLRPSCSPPSNPSFPKPLASHSQNLDRAKLKPGDISVIYVVELSEIIGKFDPNKAMKLGLKRGSKFRDLQLGQSVQSDYQNITVHPSDVMGPSVAGPIVLLVDCPTLSHLQQMVSLQSLSSYFDGVKIVSCVIHLSPSSVTLTAEYQTWMRRFGGAQHIMAGHEKKNMEIPILRTTTKMAARLNYLCPNFFPSCGFLDRPDIYMCEQDSIASKMVSVPSPTKSVAAENLLKFHLRPCSLFGLDTSTVPKLLTRTEVIDDLLFEIPEISEAAIEIGNFWNKSETNLPSCLENITREEMEIVFLGTGSSQPSKHRNVSSIFINLFSKGGLLIDCGEGTLGQLRRRFGVVGANDILRGLKCIWISHMHADHHTGLASILALRCQLLKGTSQEKIFVIAPTQLKNFLDVHQCAEDLNMQFLYCGRTMDVECEGIESYHNGPGSLGELTADFEIQQKLKKLLGEVGLEALISVPVIHCRDSFGLVLKAVERHDADGKTIPGWKLVYSGDTRPCKNLKHASNGATVLIHEATFEDNMGEVAIGKNHSTTKEAIDIGGGAYRVILTHFSQRYPKIPVFDEVETCARKTCVAFDFMSVNIADLPVLPKILPQLKLLFKYEVNAEEFHDV